MALEVALCNFGSVLAAVSSNGHGDAGVFGAYAPARAVELDSVVVRDGVRDGVGV
jgi:hypothetical protein